MAKFIMIDHSLYGVGGHHYAYAVNVLRAAEAMGHEIVLISHRDFRPPPDLPESWRLVPTFTCDAYRGFSVFSGHEPLRRMASLYPEPKSLAGRTWDWLQANVNWRNVSRTHRRRVRQRRKFLRLSSEVLDEFARQCDEVFASVEVCAADTVFVPTLTEFDLKWIVTFLADRPSLASTPWHLQFHFNFLEGREPDFSAQAEQLDAMRAHFAAQLAQVPDHRLFFYTTTRQLSAQYERLEVGRFQPLPYPVTAALPGQTEERAERHTTGPLRLVCGGCIRPEKGYEWLDSTIADLWTDYLASERVQLVIQTDVKNFPLSLPGRRKPQSVERVEQIESTNAPVVLIHGPLAEDEYARFVQAANIGLFLYDSKRYYTRCSGVLLEMLTAGVPVIVPGGCWLSAQIAEEIYAHLDEVLKTVPNIGRFSAAEMHWQRTRHGDKASVGRESRDSLLFGGSSDGVTCTLSVPGGATDLGVRLAWPNSPSPGMYVRLISRQFDQFGRAVQTFSTVLEQRVDGSATPALVHLKPGATKVQLIAENAFHDAAVEAVGVEVLVLAARSRCPAGAVGLITADHAQLPQLLADLTQNYAHYRRTVGAFAKQLTWNHLPERTVVALKSNQSLVEKAIPGVERRSRAA
jgi:glycosyltransferase involved in cell wall biosynthesis